jgi:hypothetical protein
MVFIFTTLIAVIGIFAAIFVVSTFTGIFICSNIASTALTSGSAIVISSVVDDSGEHYFKSWFVNSNKDTIDDKDSDSNEGKENTEDNSKPSNTVNNVLVGTDSTMEQEEQNSNKLSLSSIVSLFELTNQLLK